MDTVHDTKPQIKTSHRSPTLDNGRYRTHGQARDINQAIAAYDDAFDVESALPRERIRAALLRAYCAGLAADWEQALSAHDEGESLVSQLLSPDLRPTDALRLVEDLAEAGPDALAVSLTVGRPDAALVRVERWRSLVLGPDRTRRHLWERLLKDEPRLASRLAVVQARAGATLGDEFTLRGDTL